MIELTKTAHLDSLVFDGGVEAKSSEPLQFIIDWLLENTQIWLGDLCLIRSAHQLKMHFGMSDQVVLDRIAH